MLCCRRRREKMASGMERSNVLGNRCQLPWFQVVPGPNTCLWEYLRVVLQPRWGAGPSVHSLQPDFVLRLPGKVGAKGGWVLHHLEDTPIFRKCKAFPLKSPGLFFFGNTKERLGRTVRGFGSEIFYSLCSFFFILPRGTFGHCVWPLSLLHI